jgi:crotonobetainyl-CoA:carnitine CoA-transferase CaiB-like acyl-CoA transferase
LLEERTRTFRAAELLAALEKAVVPAGPINTVAQVFADPQVQARRMRIELPSAAAAAKSVPNVRAPMLIDGEAMTVDRAAPSLGEDSGAVLASLGLGESEIRALREKGVVG